MKSGCIRHPEKEPLIKIHRWQVEICDGDTTAAALLSFFEYWHNIKLEMQVKAERANDVAQMHGDERTQDESLFQFHSEEDLITGIMIAKRDTIRKGIKLLESKGFISIHANPNPRYAFDKTRYFLFHPEPINDWLINRPALPKNRPPSSKSRQSKSKNRSPSSENRLPSSENQLPSLENRFSLYTEITKEITSEISSSPLTPQRESGEEKYVKQKSVHQTPTPLPAQPSKLETQLQPLNSQADPNQDQAPYSSLDDDATLKATYLSQIPKTESNAQAQAEQQDTQRSPKYSGASSLASTDSNRQRKLPLPFWRNSAVANDYHSEFVDYLATQHLPHCSVYRQSGKQPTKGDAKNWILTREAKGEEAQIQNKWEDYQALFAKPDISKPEKQRELTVWEKQMRSQYEEERSPSTHSEEKALTKQELIAQIEAGTTRRNRGWLQSQNRSM